MGDFQFIWGQTKIIINGVWIELWWIDLPNNLLADLLSAKLFCFILHTCVTSICCIYPNGEYYFGEFKADKPHGQGTYNWTDGNYYIGEWKEGNEHGKGTYYYANGEKYTGDFIEGMKYGLGTFVYSNDDYFIGEFVAGVQYQVNFIKLKVKPKYLFR